MEDKLKNYHLGVRIDQDTKTELEKLAKVNRHKVASYARIVLEDHVAEKRKKKAE
jgi:predicted transcriptional regulator